MDFQANSDDVMHSRVYFGARGSAPGMDWTTNYTYDPYGRLKTAQEGSGMNQTYVYDAYGNRALLFGSGQYVPESGNTPQVTGDDPALVESQYGNNRWSGGGTSWGTSGNLTGTTTQSMTYDGENRLATVTAGGTTTKYVYDASGRRVQKVVGYGGANPATTTYVYDAAGQLLAEFGTATDSGRRYLTADTLGSVRLLMDQTGEPKKRYDYLPFGQEIGAGVWGRTNEYSAGVYPTAAPYLQAMGFTGKERDAETGLDYFGARYLSAAQGRFTSPDAPLLDQHPEDPKSWNLYSYTANSPLSRIDPTGQNWFNVNGTWEWHEGDTYDPDGAKGKQKPIKSNYTHLLVFQQTGYNAKGAAVGTLTLYDQDRKVAEGAGFTGGSEGFRSIDNGLYVMDLTIRDERGPTFVDPRSPDNNPPVHFGIQNIGREPLPKPGTTALYDVFGAYGPTRVRLNPASGRDRGAYFHGQWNGAGTTHGCLCYGRDTRFVDYLWTLRPQRVPLIVNQPFRRPGR